MLKRSLIFVHRWLGVGLCVFFLIWFASGIGMMYFSMPRVGPDSRLARSPALDASTIAVSPAAAAQTLGIDIGQLRLAPFDGRPAYRAAGERGGGAVLYADTGETQGDIPIELVQRAAAAWTGKPVAEAAVVEVTEVDQWTLQTRLAALVPVWKYSWPNGEQVYVSQTSGEVVQYTTTASRLGAYLGPIPHWLYFTPLRKHGPVWARVVVWTSSIGTIAAILGIVVAAWVYSPSKRYRHAGVPTAIPYRGQKRWHTILGLVFGVAVTTYTFSGLLSMGPFQWLNELVAPEAGSDEPDVAAALRDRVDAAAFDPKPPRAALTELAGLPVKELGFASFDRKAFYLARLADGDTRIVPVDGAPQSAFDPGDIARVVNAVTDGKVTAGVLTQYDRYYLDRTRREPLPVLVAQLTTGSQTRYYIDLKTARVVQAYNSGDWVDRWLYNGLHSLNFPWLYDYRPLWDIVVIALMIGGTALCVTSLVLAWRVLGRKLARASAPSARATQARV